MKISSSLETKSTMSWCRARRSWWLPETYHVSLLRRRNAYNMVINKFGDRLYNGLVQTQTEHLRVVAAKIEAAQGETFLRELKLRWDHHNKSMQMIRDILMVRHWPTLHHITLSRAHPHVMHHHKWRLSGWRETVVLKHPMQCCTERLHVLGMCIMCCSGSHRSDSLQCSA